MKITYTSSIRRFEKQGEKTGWWFIEIPSDIAGELMPGNRKSFRIKGKMDQHPVEGVSLLPMGQGNYILPVNAAMRKAIRKGEGAMVTLKIEVDTKPFAIPDWFTECLNDEPRAADFFSKLTRGHQNYFIKWIESAKTEPTRVKRIAQAINGLASGLDYGAMIRQGK